MRAIAKYGKFSVQFRTHIEEAYATGHTKTIQTPLYAHFSPEGLRAQERELAVANWGQQWNGHYQELDEATMVKPDYRIGVFDSRSAQIGYGWSDDERVHVEEQLVDYANRYPWVIVVPEVWVDPPWPKYDQFKGSAQALVRKLVEEGHDLAATLEYEEATLNRAKVIELLNETINDPEAREALEPDEAAEEVPA